MFQTKSNHSYLFIVLLLLAAVGTASGFFGKLDQDYNRAETPGYFQRDLSDSSRVISMFGGIDPMADGTFGLAGITCVNGSSRPNAILFSKFERLGMPDPGFGTDGFLTVAIPDREIYGEGLGNAVIQDDGKIIYFGIVRTTNSHVRGFMARSEADGSGLDPAFASAGVFEEDMGTNILTAYIDGTILEDGSILAVGVINSNSSMNEMLLTKFDAFGQRDISFGQNGLVRKTFANTSTVGQACCTGTDGRIYVAVYFTRDSTNYVGLLGYNDDGTMNKNFSEQGHFSHRIGDQDKPFALLYVDDFLYVASLSMTGTNDMLSVMKLNATSGSLITEFGVNGVARSAVIPELNTMAGDMVMQNDGKLVLTAAHDLGKLDTASFLYRFDADGNRDTSFGHDNQSMVYFSTNDLGILLKIAYTGSKIYGAGTIAESTNYLALVTRFDVQKIYKADFDGDSLSDIGCYYAPDGYWYLFMTQAGFGTSKFGYAGTIPFSGDFDGDGYSDIGCYYADGGWWYILKTSTGLWTTQFGYAETDPVTGDFDGDGISDFGCYSAPNGWWYLYKSMSGMWTTQFGYEGTIPVTGDFDGDGICDFGCYDPLAGRWYLYKSTSGLWTTQFGYLGTVPITGDFDGDGIDDFGCYEDDKGAWYVYMSTGGFWATNFGYSGTEPITGDYDGDGITDFGCYYPDGGWWYLYKSMSGMWTTQFGYAGTVPVD